MIINQMENNPILSILIPTKNRDKYALNVVQHILAIDNSKFQIVIQDNSDTNILESLLSDYINDSRLRYYYHSEILSFVDNFSLGISECTGEYITIIGDDDGINPLIIEFAEWARKNNIKAITPALPVIYFWPQSGVKMKTDNGVLTISDTSCNIKFVDSKTEVVKFLKQGCHNYLHYNLAKAYHGIVKKSVLEDIKLKTGRYIGGLSPDIYLSIAISLIVEKVLVVDYPLTISGICKQSGSSDSATGKHTGELINAPHFIGHTDYKWSKEVPPFYSVETIWGDSALAAIRDLKENIFLDYYREYILSVHCLMSYPQYKSIITLNLQNNHELFRNSYLIYLYIFKVKVSSFFSKYMSFLIKRIIFRKSYSIFDDVKDIKSASEITSRIIKKNTKLVVLKLSKIKNTILC